MYRFTNKYSLRKERITDYKLLIFDLDGTLYFQNLLRIDVAKEMALKCISNPKTFKDLWIIYNYRKLRENWSEKRSEASESLEEWQFKCLSKIIKVPVDYIMKVVNHYMHVKPLSLVAKHKDELLCQFINEMRNSSIKIVIYSDYPTESKIKCLELNVDKMYCAADHSINCMKPDKRGLQFILRDMDITGDEALMIGDRFEKDGLAAINNGVDYLILPKNGHSRQKVYRRCGIE